MSKKFENTAIEAYRHLRSQQIPSLRWVKSKDKRPAEGKDGELLTIKPISICHSYESLPKCYTALVYMGKYDGGLAWHWHEGTTRVYATKIAAEDWDKIEYLEESLLPVQLEPKNTWNRERAKEVAKTVYARFAGLPSELGQWFDQEYPEINLGQPSNNGEVPADFIAFLKKYEQRVTIPTDPASLTEEDRKIGFVDQGIYLWRKLMAGQVTKMPLVDNAHAVIPDTPVPSGPNPKPVPSSKNGPIEPDWRGLMIQFTEEVGYFYEITEGGKGKDLIWEHAESGHKSTTAELLECFLEGIGMSPAPSGQPSIEPDAPLNVSDKDLVQRIISIDLEDEPHYMFTKKDTDAFIAFAKGFTISILEGMQPKWSEPDGLIQSEIDRLKASLPMNVTK